MAIALVLGEENSAKMQDENEDEGEGELPKQERARRDPRRRELQNRAKKERKDLMKCSEDSKSAECLKHVLKKYDTNRDGKIGREEMNTGSKRIATEYQRSTNTLRAQNPERQKLQANA